MKVYLENVPEKYAFYLKDGRRLLSLKELQKAMETMSDEVFSHHVNPEKSDFHNWVRDVILDIELAKKLRNARTKEEVKWLLNKRVKELETTPKKSQK